MIRRNKRNNQAYKKIKLKLNIITTLYKICLFTGVPDIVSHWIVENAMIVAQPRFTVEQVMRYIRLYLLDVIWILISFARYVQYTRNSKNKQCEKRFWHNPMTCLFFVVKLSFITWYLDLTWLPNTYIQCERQLHSNSILPSQVW